MGVFVLSPCGFFSNLPLVSFEGDGSFSPIFKSSALLNQEQRQGWERVHHHQHFVTKLAPGIPELVAHANTSAQLSLHFGSHTVPSSAPKPLHLKPAEKKPLHAPGALFE